MNYLTISNHQSVPAGNIPELSYDLFLGLNITLLEDH